MKMSQIELKMTKFPKLYTSPNFEAFFSNFSTDFVNWNVEKGQQERMCFRVLKRVKCNFSNETVRN